MECDVLIEVISIKHNSGGHTSVDEVHVHYGRYDELKELEMVINEANYSNVNYVKKAFIKTLDLNKLD
jgi:hypothetical protein